MNIEYKKTKVFTAAELQGLLFVCQMGIWKLSRKTCSCNAKFLSCNFGMGWKENKKLCGLKIVSCFYAFLA